MLHGIRPGESASQCNGANRGVARINVAADGQIATIGSRQVRTQGRHIIWHSSSAGTWHGVYHHEALREAVLTTGRLSQAVKIAPPVEAVVMSYSSSGGGCAVAAAYEASSGLVMVTSGYDGRRGWTVTHLDDGRTQSADEYTADILPVL